METAKTTTNNKTSKTVKDKCITVIQNVKRMKVNKIFQNNLKTSNEHNLGMADFFGGFGLGRVTECSLFPALFFSLRFRYF